MLMIANQCLGEIYILDLTPWLRDQWSTHRSSSDRPSAYPLLAGNNGRNVSWPVDLGEAVRDYLARRTSLGPANTILPKQEF